MGFIKSFRIYILICLENLRKLIEVNFIKSNLVWRSKSFTAQEGQATIKRQVTALTIKMPTLAGASASTLGTATGGFTLPSRNTTSNTLAVFFGANIWLEIM